MNTEKYRLSKVQRINYFMLRIFYVLLFYSFHLIEGSGSFPHNAPIEAEWMIATEIGCCLRPLEIVLNEQL